MKKRIDFLADGEKMQDFYEMSKEEFLDFYSYLTEEEYDATMAAAFKKLFDAVDWYIDKSDLPYVKKIDDIRANYFFGEDALEIMCENRYFDGLSCEEIDKDKVYTLIRNGLVEADAIELGNLFDLYYEALSFAICHASEK